MKKSASHCQLFINRAAMWQIAAVRFVEMVFIIVIKLPLKEGTIP